MRATYFFTNDQPHDIDIHSANHLFAKHFPSETNNAFVNLIFLLAHHMSWFRIVRVLEQSAMDSFDTKDDETKETLF